MTKSLPQRAWGLKPKSGTKYKYAENTEFREIFQRNSFRRIFLQFEAKDKVMIHIKLTFQIFQATRWSRPRDQEVTHHFILPTYVNCVRDIFRYILMYLKYYDFLTLLVLWNQCIKDWVLHPFILDTVLQSALSSHIHNTFF